MIVDERMVTYIRSLETPETPLLEEIEQEAADTFVPVIRKETQSFLKTVLAMHRPSSILEVGTAVGFSALLMSEYTPEDCHITTIENYKKRIPIARHNFSRAGRDSRITLIEGDALEVMRGFPVRMILSLWTPQRDSISITCPRFSGCLRMEASSCPIMCFRTVISLSHGLR